MAMTVVIPWSVGKAQQWDWAATGEAGSSAVVAQTPFKGILMSI